MILILAVLYLSQSFIHASPLPFFQRDATSSTASLPYQCTCPNQRSLWDILWSCLATIFACSWVSVHPNMAGPGESWRKVALRRLELMFWAIIAPEMIILWAMRQWFGARNLARLYQRKGWTKTHGYFIQMGGFMLYEGDQARGILSPEQLNELYQHGKIDFPTVTEEEIKDRSKADALAKTFVLGQTTWFIAQCLARGIQGLVLTEIELVTVAFAFLNGFMYFLWWNKPLDVQSTVPVHLLDVPKNRSSKKKIAVNETTPPKNLDVQPSGLVNLLDPLEDKHDEVHDMNEPTPSENILFLNRSKRCLLNVLHSITLPFRHATTWIWKLVKKKGMLWILNAIFLRGPACGIIMIFTRVGEMMESNSAKTIRTGQMRVATFYAVEILDSDLRNCIIVTSSIAVAFGAIHCAGWFLVFPSRAEALIWKLSSITITGVPLSMVIGGIGGILHEHFRHDYFKKLFDIMGTMVGIFMSFALPVYIAARLLLLVEALIGLRVLSPGALSVVKWASFIPHI